MTIWIIEPQDPLLVRDGRPFGANPGARARSLPFPFPSTTSGAARTRAGEDNNGRFNESAIANVAEMKIRGPLLLNLEDPNIASGTAGFLPPAPLDCLIFPAAGKRLTLKQLVPLKTPAEAVVDNEMTDQQLAVVGLREVDLRKPAQKAPAFWRWEQFEEWLVNPGEKTVSPSDLGIPRLSVDRRTHVAIDPDTLTGRDGALFMTAGLSFYQSETEGFTRLSTATRLGLAIDVEDTSATGIDTGFGPMGGERRLMHWQAPSLSFPELPQALNERVSADGFCRLILLTPAFFEGGWKPDWLLQTRNGVTVELLAAVVGKPETVSGWDLVARGPRPSRRLAPAGSVFFLKLHGQPDDLRRWLDTTWFQCVSDAAADRAAGFGLAALGVFDGNLHDMQLSSKEANHA